MHLSEGGFDIGFKVHEGIHIGQWILIIASFETDLVAIPSDMMLFQIDSHHQCIAFPQTLHTDFLLIVQITQSSFAQPCNQLLIFNLLGRSLGNDELEPQVGVVLLVRSLYDSLWNSGAKPNKGSTCLLRSICDGDSE